ncbi:PHD finger protein [Spatholobus suberectus]|nr:PHD finger protein [Spatholobus suberectus]
MHLGGKSVPNDMIVYSRCNPISSAVEFRLNLLSSPQNGSDAISSHPSEEQVIPDLRYLLDSLVHLDEMANNAPRIIMRKLVVDSTRTLLDCKHSMKDFKLEKVAAEHPRDTLADLKNEVTIVFQELYVMYKKFQAEKLLEFGSIDDSYTLKFLLRHKYYDKKSQGINNF